MRGTDISALAVLLFAITSLPCQSQVNVVTWHDDNWRTGQNTQESILTQATVGHKDSNGHPDQFGLLCTITLLPQIQGFNQVYAQPLVLSHGDGSMTVYVATMNDYLYAYSIPPRSAFGSCPTFVSTGTPVNLLQNYPSEAPAARRFAVPTATSGAMAEGRRSTLENLVSADGLEPSTHALKGRGRLSPVAWIHHFRSVPDPAGRGETSPFGA
jgi:hypothetical protein